MKAAQVIAALVLVAVFAGCDPAPAANCAGSGVREVKTTGGKGVAICNNGDVYVLR